VPHLAVGLLLVIGSATGFVVAFTHAGHRHSVLALARAVTVGQVLTDSDVRQVEVSVDADVATIPGSQLSSVVGQTVGASLPAGALLTRAELGASGVPAQGQAVIAVLVKPGQFPPSLAAGAHVLLVAAPPGTGGTSPTAQSGQSGQAPWSATVVDVQVLDNEQGTVASLQLAQAAARQVAALPAGQLSVVVVP
jgi:hypothetical protein